MNTALPHFDLDIDSIIPTLTKMLSAAQTQWQGLLKDNKEYTWDNLIEPLEAVGNDMHLFWSIVAHLNHVKSNPALRDAYEEGDELLTAYHHEMSHNTTLYQAYQSIFNRADFPLLNQAQQQTIRHAIRDFKLAGVDLSEEDKAQYQTLEQALHKACHHFEHHVMNATDAWHYHTLDKQELDGLPVEALAQFANKARELNKEGYVIGLDQPSYLSVITHANHRPLREKIYHAYVTRASELGDNPDFDNSGLFEEILSKRLALAQLLQFPHYAEYARQTKMAKSCDEIMTFLDALLLKIKPRAQEELAELQAFAKTQLMFDEPLQPWDLSFFSEKLREYHYAFNEEELRPYFPLPQVLNGLFAITSRLFGIRWQEEKQAETWHADVQCFSLHNDKTCIGHIYIDLYPRAQKQGGAWMDDCRDLYREKDELQLPIAFVTANVSTPNGDAPALLRHDEVATLFHEFGHALHLLLTKIDIPSVGGLNGVTWDFVELPSQFLENWCWQKETLPLISAHYQTGQPLPHDLLDKVLAAKNFQSALHLVRQVEFALFDMQLHTSTSAHPNAAFVQQTLDRIRQKVAVVPSAEFNRFQHGFTHVFSGGYAAGYYSYLWADILASDAFSAFKEEGLLNSATGQRFVECILAKGGSEEMLDLFVHFRGRKPQPDAFLIANGFK